MNQVSVSFLLAIAIAGQGCKYHLRAPEITVFRDQKCGVSFQVPSGWTAFPLAPDDTRANEKIECTIAMEPVDWKTTKETSEYDTFENAVTIEVLRAPFEEAALLSDLKNSEGRWVVDFGRGAAPAQEFRTPYASGLRATVNYGIFRKSGEDGYQGLGQYEYLILSSGERSVRIALFEASTEPDDPFMTTLQSLRF